jgi:hypothetical protein
MLDDINDRHPISDEIVLVALAARSNDWRQMARLAACTGRFGG